MSRKDRRLFMLLCVLTSILLSLILNEIRFRYKYGNYIMETYNNSIEAIEALEKIDSTYVID